MEKEQAFKILKQTKNSYDHIAGKFSNTRHREWPIMDVLVDKYINSKFETCPERSRGIGNSKLKILDLGCGNGRLYELFKDKKVDYLGIDSSAELIAQANKTGGRFKVQDILELDYQAEFDAVLAFAVLNHLPSDELRQEIFQKINQALKPGGVFICTNWNLWRWSLKQKTIWRYWWHKEPGLGWKDVMTYFQDGGCKYPLYYYTFTKNDLRRLAKAAGFEILEVYHEKKGQKSGVWTGDNLVLVCRKKVV